MARYLTVFKETRMKVERIIVDDLLLYRSSGANYYCTYILDKTMGKKEPTGEVTLYSDGKYRWVYEKSLWKHPTVLYTILNIFIGMDPS